MHVCVGGMIINLFEATKLLLPLLLCYFLLKSTIGEKRERYQRISLMKGEC